ncbi:helix-turn-helix domain-containing protein [Planktothrix sp. PCC 11201]
MKARYRYRIYPTNQQKRLMSQLFGCCRVVFNDDERLLPRTISRG